MPRVLITTPFPTWPLLRQTPGRSGRWGDFTFFVNEPLESCDAWVAFEEVPERLSTVCPAENTMFITAEPPALRRYRDIFLSQFRWVVTCHEIAHRGRIDWHQGHPWHVGVDRDSNDDATWDYDRIAQFAGIDKPGLISTVISNKAITPDHRQRIAFVSLLKEAMGDALHVYGRGFRPIADKWDAVGPYRFHLALENERRPNFLTEKLSDALLGLAYPFYYGCPNAADFFPEEAFTSIDIHEPETAVATILEAVATDLDRQRHAAVRVARQRVLDQHNLFPMLARLLSERMSHQPPRRVRLVPRRHRVELAMRHLTRRLAA